MRHTVLVFALAGLLSAQVKPGNAGFETGEPGGLPASWMGGGGGFTVKLVDQGCHNGRCAEMTGTANPEPNVRFGNLAQMLPAAGYAMRQVRYRAWVRVEGAETRAQMWLRLDRPDGSMAFLENMQARPIVSSEWKEYEIATTVPENVSRMLIGVMLFGPGKAWVDDVALDVKAEVVKDKVEPGRPLTAQGLVNLTAFAKLYGYVRFFHPSDQAAWADWETAAVEGVRKVEGAADRGELIARLREVFGPLGPTVQVFAAGSAPVAAEGERGPEVVRQKHSGVGLPTATAAMGVYRSERVRKPAAEWEKPFEAELVPGVRAIVPLTVYADQQGTLPHAGPMQAAPVYERTGDDRGARLGAIVIAWNVFQHFYPYFDVVKTDWAAELPKGLKSAAADADKYAFASTLGRLVAALKDGHGRVGAASQGPWLWPPVVLDWVEGQLVVTRVAKGVEGVAPGDRVLEIDGKPVEQVAAAGRETISAATDGWMRMRLASDMSRCDTATGKMRLTLEPRRTVELACLTPRPKDPERYTEPRPAEKIAELEPGIVYVDLDRVDQKEFDAAVARLEKAKGIVFDMRGYPSQPGISALAHLTDSPLRSARWNVPSMGAPDRTEVSWVESGWPVPPQKPYFAAKRVFLIDGRAISYAETVMGIVEAFKLGEIVGEPTAGTNGNVNPFRLPGGYTVSWTGMKVLKHDGSQHHGIGIRPTVPASRTRKGVAEGKDEILLKGLDVVKR